MFKKLKYKLWKHLTKELVSDEIIKKAALVNTYASMHRSKNSVPELDADKKYSPPKITTETINTRIDAKQLPKIVAINGLFYSGSSTLVGLFQEFDNIRVVGYPEKPWIKNVTDKEMQSECCFMSQSGFVEMIQSFKKESPEAISLKIRKFISSINNAYKNKRVAAWENLPGIYNDTFKEITQKLLFSILDLDDHTKEFMQSKLFPHVAKDVDEFPFDSCSFVLGKGRKRYLSYRFADLTDEEFKNHVSEYLEKFFSILEGKEFVAYDQFLPKRYLEALNQYMRNPIKQIVVVRDPRDQFLSIYRRDITWWLRSAKDIKDHHINRLSEFPEDNPHRIIIRFEDIVLNYEHTKRRIMNFLGLKSENHVAPKSIFDPSISVTNIGAYRKFHRQEYIQEIEKELGEYCFYPEKENLSNEAIQLLISSGNWDDKFGINNKSN